jgi:hypothetical protein
MLPGWRTERGRTLLKYGFPTQRNIFPQRDAKVAAEEWFYSEIRGGVYFYFVDRLMNNTFILAHSTMPPNTTALIMFKTLIKKLYNIAGIKIKSEDGLLMPDLYYNQEILMYYKQKDGSVVQSTTWTVTNVSTLATVGDAIRSTFDGFAAAGTVPGEFLTLRLFTQYGTIGTARQLLSEIDLTHVVFDITSHSYFKIQNRTINSENNDTSEDVDNVPIYGKYFDFNTNGTIFRDYSQPVASGSSAITTQRSYGVLSTTLPSDTETNMFKELPLSSQFIGCKGQGKAHLDPGEIKTSVMLDNVKIGLQ